MNSVLGIVFSNMHEHMISELTAHRCMGSIPVGGRYRLIDFSLSALTNAGVEQVGIITKSNYQSLMDHLGNGREWDLSRKNGGLVILPPFGRSDAGMYHGRVEAFAGIMDYIQNSNAQYVLATDCNMMANLDFTKFMEAHKQSGADITLMYKKMEMDTAMAKDVSVLLLDRENRVSEMLINPQITGEQNVYLNVMLLERTLLEQLIEENYNRNLFLFEKDVLQANLRQYKIHGCEFTGYMTRFDSMKTYFDSNMSLLQPQVRRELFPQSHPIYTKVRDEAPVKYGLDARVANSLLADGCVVEGEVENSVLFRGVRVGKGAKVKNSIIMQGTSVGAGSSLDYVMTDKNVTIKESRMIMGFETYPVYISKGSVV